MLCTTMVVVVRSVMGGWLNMFRESFHGLTGDIVIEGDTLSGFPHYQEMIRRVEALPEVEAAVPTIYTFGLINIANIKTDGVQVLGYPIEKISRIHDFDDVAATASRRPGRRGGRAGNAAGARGAAAEDGGSCRRAFDLRTYDPRPAGEAAGRASKLGAMPERLPLRRRRTRC